MPALRSSSTTPNRTAVPTGPATWQVLAAVICITGYIAWFYWFDPRPNPVGLTPRQMIISQLLVPEELVSSWVDRDWSRFGVLDHIPVLAGAAMICLISGLTGWLALYWSRSSDVLDTAEQVVVSLAVGLNVWSLLTLALGLAGFLKQRGLFAALAVLFVVLASWQIWRIRHQRRLSGTGESTNGKDVKYQPLTRFGRLALAMCLPLTLVILLGGTLPASHFDVREYHLQVPKEWFQQGRVSFLPHNVYGNMPLGAEMHAILGMLMSSGKDDWWWGALIGKTVIAAFAPLAAAGVFLIGRRFVSSDAGAWGAFAYLSTPWVAHVSMTGLIDGVVGGYVVTAMLVALLVVLPGSLPSSSDGRSCHSRREPLLAIAGFLAGGAVACKYPALVFLVAPLGVLIAILPNRLIPGTGERDTGAEHTASKKLSRGRPLPTDTPRRVDACVVFSLAVIAGCGLWFGKNWVLSGNPTYPLLYSVFDGKSWNAEKDARWTKAHGPPRDANGNRFSLAQAWDSATLLLIGSDHHGPWLVPLAVAAFATWRSRQSRRLVAIVYGLTACAVLSWWLLTHRVDRFLVPMLPLVAVGAGIGATWTNDGRWRRMAGLLGGGCCLLSFAQIASPYAADNRFLIALSDLRTDLPRSESQPFTRMNDGHRWLNENVPPGSQVLLVGEAQVFDLEMPILYNTCFDDSVLENLLKNRSREERIKILRDLRISYIFVSWYELQRYREPGNYGYSDYPTRELFYDELVREQGLLRPVPVGKGREVFEIFQVVDSQDAASRRE